MIIILILQAFKTSQDSYNTVNDSNISTINSSLLTKQDVINSSNKLNISNVNLDSSALSYVDISSSLQSQLTALSNKDIHMIIQ